MTLVCSATMWPGPTLFSVNFVPLSISVRPSSFSVLGVFIFGDCGVSVCLAFSVTDLCLNGAISDNAMVSNGRPLLSTVKEEIFVGNLIS